MAALPRDAHADRKGARLAAADAPPGRYPLGDGEVEATPAGRVQIPGQANLAGSALTLDRAVKKYAAKTKP